MSQWFVDYHPGDETVYQLASRVGGPLGVITGIEQLAPLIRTAGQQTQAFRITPLQAVNEYRYR